jgi:transcription elongation factor Elf1
MPKVEKLAAGAEIGKGVILKAQYAWDCPVCNFAAVSAPSMEMLFFRKNSGWVKCPCCKTILSVMINEMNSKYDARIFDCYNPMLN